MRSGRIGNIVVAGLAATACASMPAQVGLEPLTEADRQVSTSPFPVNLPKPANTETPPPAAIGPVGPLQTLPAWMRGPSQRVAVAETAAAPRAAGAIPFPNAPVAPIAAPPPETPSRLAAATPPAPSTQPAPPLPVEPSSAVAAPPSTCEIEVLDGWVNAMPPGPPQMIVVGEVWPPAGTEGVFVRNVRLDGRQPVTVILELDARRRAPTGARRAPEPFRYEEPAREDLHTIEIVCEGRTLGRLRDVPRAY